MSQTSVFEWHIRFRADWNVETVRKQSQEHAHHSLTSNGLFIKNSSWQAKQSILHTTVTFYCGCVKMCEDFAANLGDKRTGCCITTMHSLTLSFSPGNLWPKTTWPSSPSTLLFSICPIEYKTERPSFWHNWDDRGGTERPHRTRLPGCI
jgi:hypothetical protein